MYIFQGQINTRQDELVQYPMISAWLLNVNVKKQIIKQDTCCWVTALSASLSFTHKSCME